MPKLNPKPATLLLLLGSLLFVSVAGNGQTLYNTSYYTAVSEDGPPSEFPGAIVKYDVPSRKITKVHDFSRVEELPYGPTICSNGKIYGLIGGGGKYGKGTLYVFNTATAEYTPLLYFKHDGPAYKSKLIQAADGKLYGLADSSVFSFDPATNNYTVIKEGDFSLHSGQIVQALNGKLYGTITNGGSKHAGSIYSVDLVTHEYNDVFEFDSLNGKRPGNLALALNGKLYGTTGTGGNRNQGVIFSFDPVANIFTKLKDFNGDDGSYPESIEQAADGKLYGSAVLGGVNNWGVIFSFDPALSKYAVLKSFSYAEGGIPREILRASDGNIYGVSNYSSFFSFNPVTNIYKVFDNYLTGFSEVNGKLYGTANKGIVSFDLASEVFTFLGAVGYDGGIEPEGSLVQAPDGKLYGTTRLGGDFDNGTIYSFDPVSSEFVRLKSFRFTNGYAPETKLLPAKNGKLYGTTSGGGTTGNGVLFSFNTATKEYKKLIDFDSSIGKVPGTLIQAANGMIYGTTNSGGHADAGVIFSYNINTAAYKLLYHFSTATGSNPAGAMVLAKNGLLYGTTTYGGPKNQGIFFSFNPATAVYTPLLTGIAYRAQNPSAGLMQAADGKIYGTAIGKGYDDYGYTHNVLFSFDPSDYSIYLSKEIGADIHTLMQASDGLIYGAYFKGYYKSYVFSFNPKTHTFRIGKNVYDKGIYPLKSFVEYLPAKPAVFNPEVASLQKLSLQNTSFTVKVFPNPSLAAFRLAIQSPLAKEVDISVTDIAGRTLYQTNGSSSATYSFGNTFPKGVYFVRVTQGAATETLRLEKGGR